MDPDWAAALARALTGEAVAVPESADVLAELAAVGWDRPRLARHAEATWSAGEPWPHPDPAALKAFGAARWSAALADCRRRLGLETTPMPPSPRTRLDADERRLLADKPPHW
jgi:hypothetical protein